MLKGKSAVITGSTSGIGLGIAKVLAKNGCSIMLSGFGDEAEIEKIRGEIESEYGVLVHYSNADLSDPDEAVGLILESEQILGKVDILVNNAGVQYVDEIEHFPRDKWDLLIAVNLSASYHTIRTAIGGMKKRGWGRIINIASAHGLVASANKVAYVASKHGLVGLTKVVALENATDNLTCNAICPGWVLTPLVQKQIDIIAERAGISTEEAELGLLSEKQPAKRFAQPEEIGEMAVYLCSDAARLVTGTTLSIDGGWTAQ